ncbi:MAG: hypothetical protein ACJ8GN_14080 [Longimicrobiaceae bacterium]
MTLNAMISPTYENSVFINCPFDATYRPLFEAVVFAVYDCGFFPRCALEIEDGSQVRIDKINGIIRDCRLAVHDISSTQLDSVNRLPRFNMPFEFGIFVGAKAFGSEDHRRKACIVLDSERYRYQKFISDIAGQDIREHDRRPSVLIRQVRDFLSAYFPHAAMLPGGRTLASRFQEFRRQLPTICGELCLDRRRLTFRDLSGLAVTWIRSNPLPHHAAVSTPDA